jgi:hypothetical protein
MMICPRVRKSDNVKSFYRKDGADFRPSRECHCPWMLLRQRLKYSKNGSTYSISLYLFK